MTKKIYLAGPIRPTESEHRWRTEIKTSCNLPSIEFVHTGLKSKVVDSEERVKATMEAIKDSDGVLVYYDEEDAWRTGVEAFVASQWGKPVVCYLGGHRDSIENLDHFLQFSVDSFHRQARQAINKLYEDIENYNSSESNPKQ